MTIISQPTQVRASRVPTLAHGLHFEDIQYKYFRREHELILTLRGVEDQLVVAVTRGEAEFALVDESPLLVLCARFGVAVPWVASPFCWHHTPSKERVLPPALGSEDEARIQIQILLVEAEDKTIRASRCVTFSLDFTRALNEAIREQARLPFDPRGQERSHEKLRRRCPTPESMVAYAAARTPGFP